MIDKKQFIKDFEDMKNNAELNALSKVSLERPLTDKELEIYKRLFNENLSSKYKAFINNWCILIK